jgi:hypothetical protein
MIPKEVSAEQFSVDCDLITHEPTGAQFLVVPNGLVSTCWGLAGIAPGAEYDPAELKGVAQEIMSFRRRVNVS